MTPMFFHITFGNKSYLTLLQVGNLNRLWFACLAMSGRCLNTKSKKNNALAQKHLKMVAILSLPASVGFFSSGEE